MDGMSLFRWQTLSFQLFRRYLSGFAGTLLQQALRR
jgi:hypothetical protein